MVEIETVIVECEKDENKRKRGRDWRNIFVLASENVCQDSTCLVSFKFRETENIERSSTAHI